MRPPDESAGSIEPVTGNDLMSSALNCCRGMTHSHSNYRATP